mgnify:CR=1 FL=1
MYILILLVICICLFMYHYNNTKKENFKVINKLQIIVTMYNPKPEYLMKCLKSIESQTFKFFNLCIIDDKSDDEYIEDYREILGVYCKKNSWKKILAPENKGPLVSRMKCIKALYPSDDDIIVSIDGDDELYNSNVFETINDHYQDDTMLTFGNYVNRINGELIDIPKYNCKKREQTFKIMKKKNKFRTKWIFSHLKTFKFKLYKNIKDKDLRDTNNNYYKSATDLAIMYPMLEMCGGKFKCINDPLYIYNKSHPESNHNQHSKKKLQIDNGKEIKKKKPYNAIF